MDSSNSRISAGQQPEPGRIHSRFAAAEYGLSPAAAPEVSGFPALAAVADEDNATLGTRGGTGAERSEASGGAERSEASELPRTLPAEVPTPLGREELGLPSRQCLICGRPVRECMRARTHTTEELLAKISEMVENY